MTRLVVALLAGGLFAATGFGATPDPKDLAIPAQELSKARELVRKLGSEIYRDREEAYAELVKMGRLARPALLEAASSDADPEVRFRSSRLLPKAGADELAARLETFLADKDGKFDHELPGLKQYRKVLGADEKARSLFVEIVKSPYNLEMLQALDRGVTEGGRAISDRRTLLFSQMQHRNIGGRVSPPQQASLADLACLLFAEAVTPSKDIPRSGMWNHITGATFLQQPASMNTLNNPSSAHSDAYRRIIGQWLESRDEAQDLNQLAHLVGQQQLRGFPQSLPLLRRIVTTEGVHGYAKGQALMFLVQQRGKEEHNFITTLLNNDTLVTTVWFGNNINPKNMQPQQHQCLLRDVALAMLVTQSGQKMKDYGYAFPNNQPEPNPQSIGYGNYAFPTDEARTGALVKYGFWRLKQSFKEPVKEPVKEPAPQPQPPVPTPAPIK